MLRASVAQRDCPHSTGRPTVFERSFIFCLPEPTRLAFDVGDLKEKEKKKKKEEEKIEERRLLWNSFLVSIRTCFIIYLVITLVVVIVIIIIIIIIIVVVVMLFARRVPVSLQTIMLFDSMQVS